MTKKVSKEEALKAVKTITKEISESSLEQEALEAVKTLILWAGDDPEREGLVDTPKRVVKAYKEFFAGYDEVPIVGVAHIGYIPKKRVVGISKLARLVDLYGKRLQTQETMTAQIADTIEKVLQPKGVAVVIDANHQCMSTRGVHKTESSTITSRMLGIFRTDNKAREEFISLIHSPKKY